MRPSDDFFGCKPITIWPNGNDLHTTFTDYLETNEAVKSAVNKYNNQRPHASCNYLVPAEVHQNTGEMKKKWYPKKWQKLADHAFDNAKVN